MAANDDEQNDLDAAEGLADLNRIALQDLPINREDEEMEGIAVNGPYDESDLLSTQFSSRAEAYQALQLHSFHRTKISLREDGSIPARFRSRAVVRLL